MLTVIKKPGHRRRCEHGIQAHQTQCQNPQGGITKQEAAVHISNLNLVDPSSGEATRIGRKLNDKNKLVRYAKKSGEEIK